MLRKWEDFPEKMKNEYVYEYYKILSKKKISLFLKRIFDVIFSFLLLIVLSPVFIIISILIKLDSSGPVFFRQVRITQYGEEFRIFKFRTMYHNKVGSSVTVKNDNRVTPVGKYIRKYRLDEICQLIDILRGTMTFVGTRPEVPQYVSHYDDEMLATLLLPAGVTSQASIEFKDEEKLLEGVRNIDEVYVNEILPQKMKYNLNAIKEFSIFLELKIMLLTIKKVFL